MSGRDGGGGGVVVFALVLGGLFLIAHHTPSTQAVSTSGATSSGGNARIGQRLAAQHGWTGQQWSCLNELWTRESGWRVAEQGRGW